MSDGPEKETVRIAVLIPAAGSGKRLGLRENKVLLPLGDTPLIGSTVRVFREHPRVERIGLIVRDEDRPALERCFPPGDGRAGLMPWIGGGAKRQDSVFNGLRALESDPPDWVLVHDGARPFCSRALIDRVLAGLADAKGVVPVLPVKETLRRIEAPPDTHMPTGTVVDRDGLYFTQTPQGFHFNALLQAHIAAGEKGLRGTDDAQLLEVAGVSLAFVEGDAGNLKVTTEEDYRFAQWRRAH